MQKIVICACAYLTPRIAHLKSRVFRDKVKACLRVKTFELRLQSYILNEKGIFKQA